MMPSMNYGKFAACVVVQEDINDNPTTIPSKRILDLLPEYVKTVSSLLILKQIGLTKLREDCPHFGQWIIKILRLAPPAV